MEPTIRALRKFVLLSELVFSLAVPLLLFIVGAKWLRGTYHLGKWVMLLGVLLGVLGAIAGLVRVVKSLLKDDAPKKDFPPTFNDHT